MIHSLYTLRALTIGLLFCLIGILNAQIPSDNFPSIDTLESRIAEIKNELSHLAEFTIRGGVGAVGYRSRTPDNAVDPKEWVQITLPSASMVDRIVLVPCLWRSPDGQLTADSFPLDFKIIGGTGDAQLSLVQTIPLDGALIVTTPQPAACNVARRGARMFEKVNVPLLGVAENMSYLEAPDGSRQALFGEGGGQATADNLQTALLGQIPIDPAIRQGCDQGVPIVVGAPESPAAKVFFSIAQNILDQMARLQKNA